MDAVLQTKKPPRPCLTPINRAIRDYLLENRELVSQDCVSDIARRLNVAPNLVRNQMYRLRREGFLPKSNYQNRLYCRALRPEVVLLVAEGLPDKLIIHKLNLTVSKLRTSLLAWKKYLGAQHRVSIPLLAYAKGVLVVSGEEFQISNNWRTVEGRERLLSL